jgi:hypothetical protein
VLRSLFEFSKGLLALARVDLPCSRNILPAPACSVHAPALAGPTWSCEQWRAEEFHWNEGEGWVGKIHAYPPQVPESPVNVPGNSRSMTQLLWRAKIAEKSVLLRVMIVVDV